MYRTLDQALAAAQDATRRAQEHFEDAHGDDDDMMASVALLYSSLVEIKAAINDAIGHAKVPSE